MGFVIPLAVAAVDAAGFTETAGAIAGLGGFATEAGTVTAGSSSLASIGSIASTAGSLISGIGAIAGGRSGAASAKYNAALASNNAEIAEQNKTFAAHAGEEQAAQEELKTRAQVGGIIANQAAAGVDVGTGSAVDVRSSAKQLGELNAINVRANAARTAYGYENQATSDESQAQLDKYEAGQDTAGGEIAGGASIIGGLGNTAFKYGQYITEGGNGNPLSF